MNNFYIERESKEKGKIRYFLTEQRKFIEDYGMANVYGVRCIAETGERAEVKDISCSEKEAINFISLIACQKVMPNELLFTLSRVIK